MADDAYEVEVDDKDGKVTGLWGPQDGNGETNSEFGMRNSAC